MKKRFGLNTSSFSKLRGQDLERKDNIIKIKNNNCSPGLKTWA
ncbi:hypothetical protein [Desulfothermus sp.]